MKAKVQVTSIIRREVEVEKLPYGTPDEWFDESQEQTLGELIYQTIKHLRRVGGIESIRLANWLEEYEEIDIEVR
ncbi:MAG: hypothetical protein IJR86_00635 [Bacteroidaceae bacterium]|nr:hypothetical protein [Bacteroidaceae bacterium]